MITKIIEGKYGISRHEFNTHLEKSKGDEDHDTSCREGFFVDASNSDDIKKKDGEQRYQVF